MFQKIQSRARRILFILLIILLIVVLAVLLLLFFAIQAAKSKPAFYKEALKLERAVLARNNEKIKEKSRKAFEKVSLDKPEWSADFDEEEINGFFALNTKLLPPGVRDPRVFLRPDNKIEMACTVEKSGLSGVADIVLDVQSRGPNEFEIQFLDAHLGLYPVSKETIRDLLAEGLQNSGAILEKKTIRDEPGLVVKFQFHLDKKLSLLIKELKIADGAFLFSGSVEKRK